MDVKIGKMSRRRLWTVPLEKNEYLPGQLFTKQDLESLNDPEQDEPPYFSTCNLDLVLDCVPPLPQDLEHDE